MMPVKLTSDLLLVFHLLLSPCITYFLPFHAFSEAKVLSPPTYSFWGRSLASKPLLVSWRQQRLQRFRRLQVLNNSLHQAMIKSSFKIYRQFSVILQSVRHVKQIPKQMNQGFGGVYAQTGSWTRG